MTSADSVGPRRLVRLARDSEERGDTAQSLQFYEQAIEALRDDSDLELLADAWRWKGTLHREQGETETAHNCYKESLRYAVPLRVGDRKAHCYKLPGHNRPAAGQSHRV